MSYASCRAIDIHVHPSTTDWLDGSMGPYVASAEQFFKRPFERMSLDELAEMYRRLDTIAVLLAWDAETATGRPRVTNDTIAGALRAHPDAFLGFGSVDPWKGERAVADLDEIAELGLAGVKLHPSMQTFYPDDEQHWPLFERCQALGLVCLVHTGTSGVGVGKPGGGGIRIDYSRPIRLDAPAASFPELQFVAAHFGWPWHMELMAIARHKSNIWIDISGWSPHHIPLEVVAAMAGGLQDRFLFGSDFPFLVPERSLREIDELGLQASVMEKLLRGNAMRLLKIDPESGR